MKKITALVLTLALCLSFSACGKSMTAEQKKLEEEAMYAKLVSNLAVVVKVSINPEFELLIDDAGLAVDVIRLNEDAKAAFAGLEPDPLPCGEMMEKLLSMAEQNGFLTEKSKVEVAAYAKGGVPAAADYTASLEKALADYSEKVAFSYSVELQQQELPETEQQSDPAEEDAEPVLYETFEIENGSCEIFYDENGVRTKELYHFDDGTESETLFHPNGVPQRVETFWGNGTYTLDLKDPDGSMTYQLVDSPTDGYQEMVYEGGILKSVVRTDPASGDKVEEEYDENGNLSRSFLTVANGTTVETTYRSGVKVVEEAHDAVNGGYQVTTYNSAGVRVSAKSYGPGDYYSYLYYDDSGNLIEHEGFDNFGRPVHVWYNPDGTTTCKFTEGGTVLVYVYDGAGNIIDYWEE